MGPPEEMVGLRWIIQSRVSSSSQTDNTRSAKQLSDPKDEDEARDGRVVKRYNLTESAVSMDRESLEGIAELPEMDKFDILGVYEETALTSTGHDRATVLHESHVTLSWFFRSVLDLETDESEAMELPRVSNLSMVDRLATVLPVVKLHREDVI